MNELYAKILDENPKKKNQFLHIQRNYSGGMAIFFCFPGERTQTEHKTLELPKNFKGYEWGVVKRGPCTCRAKRYVFAVSRLPKLI